MTTTKIFKTTLEHVKLLKRDSKEHLSQAQVIDRAVNMYLATDGYYTKVDVTDGVYTGRLVKGELPKN